MTARAPDHKLSSGAWDGGCVVVHSFGTMLATTAASRVSTTYAAPHDTKVKEFSFDLKAIPAATGRVNLRVGGTSVGVKDVNGLAAGTFNTFAEGDFTTTFRATDKRIARGARITVTLENKALLAAQGVITLNPL